MRATHLPAKPYQHQSPRFSPHDKRTNTFRKEAMLLVMTSKKGHLITMNGLCYIYIYISTGVFFSDFCLLSTVSALFELGIFGKVFTYCASLAYLRLILLGTRFAGSFSSRPAVYSSLGFNVS